MNTVYETNLNANDYLSKRLNEADAYRRAKKVSSSRRNNALLNALMSIFR